jgi:hypothetical protein
MKARKEAIRILFEVLAIQRVTAYLALQKGDQLILQLRAALAGLQQKSVRRKLDFGRRITAMLDRVEQQRSFLRRLCDSLALQITYYANLNASTGSKTRTAAKRSEKRA